MYARQTFAIMCDVPVSGGCLMIVDENGKEINCIWTVADFGDISPDVYVTMDTDKDHVFLTNSRNRKIVGISYSGEVVFNIEVRWTPHLLACVEDYLAIVNIKGRFIRFLRKKDGSAVKIAPIYLRRPPRYMAFDSLRRRLMLFSRNAPGAISVVSMEKLLQLSLRIV